MNRLVPFVIACVPLVLLGQGENTPKKTKAKLDPLDQWGQWRGPLATGEAPRGDPPTEWNEDKNIRWKTAIPGKSHASPIVWGNQVFILSAVAHGEKLKVPEQPPGAHNNDDPDRKTKFVAMSLNRRTGEILWQKTVRDAQPHQSAHQSTRRGVHVCAH